MLTGVVACFGVLVPAAVLVVADVASVVVFAAAETSRMRGMVKRNEKAKRKRKAKAAEKAAAMAEDEGEDEESPEEAGEAEHRAALEQQLEDQLCAKYHLQQQVRQQLAARNALEQQLAEQRVERNRLEQQLSEQREDWGIVAVIAVEIVIVGAVVAVCGSLSPWSACGLELCLNVRLRRVCRGTLSARLALCWDGQSWARRASCGPPGPGSRAAQHQLPSVACR